MPITIHILGCSLAEARNATNDLISSNWTDVRTRAVFLELLLYNPNTDLYSSSACVFEYFTCGGFFSTVIFNTMNLDKYLGIYGTTSIVLLIVFFVFLICYIGIIIKRVVQQNDTFIKVYCRFCILAQNTYAQFVLPFRTLIY